MAARASQPLGMAYFAAYLCGAAGALASYLLATGGEHVTAIGVALIAAAPGLLTYRETRRNRAEIRRRRTIVTRGDTQVTITDEDLEELEPNPPEDR